MLQQSLSIHDFANQKYEVAPGQVTGVLVDGERVWVKIEAQVGIEFTMVEVKNVEPVTEWGRVTDKLEDFNVS